MKYLIENLNEILSHYDGSQAKAVEVLNVLMNVSEKTRVSIMQMILSFCQLCSFKKEDIDSSSLPATTNVMTVRIVKNRANTRGVAGNYRLWACKRNSDGTETEPIEIPFSTRAGKVLYTIILAFSCPELGDGKGFNRTDIRLGKEIQHNAIFEIFNVMFGGKIKTEKVKGFIEGIGNKYSFQYFCRTKHDTNHLIASSFDILDSPSFLILGEKNQVRRINASLDIEQSDPDIINCLRAFIEATAIVTALPVPFRKSLKE